MGCAPSSPMLQIRAALPRIQILTTANTFENMQMCRYAQISVTYCPVMSFVFVCIEIQNENQLSWATKIRGTLPKIQILTAAVI